MSSNVAFLVVGLVVGVLLGAPAGVVLGSMLERKAWWRWVERNGRPEGDR